MPYVQRKRCFQSAASVSGASVRATARGSYSIRPPPRAERPRDDRDRVELGEGGAVEVLAGHVLDRLERGERGADVADLDVPADGRDRRVGEAPDEVPDRVAGDDRVGVDADDDLASRVADAVVRRRGLPAVDLAEAADARILCREGGGDGEGPVGRSVVDDEHLDARVVAREERADGRAEDLLLVEGGDEDGDERRGGGGGAGDVAARGAAPAERQDEEQEDADRGDRGAGAEQRTEEGGAVARQHGRGARSGRDRLVAGVDRPGDRVAVLAEMAVERDNLSLIHI